MSRAEAVLGLPGLDTELEPCLPPGWVALLLGASGSGSHLFAKQFAQAGVGDAPVFYYSTHERPDDVARAFREFGWDPDGLRIGDLSADYYSKVIDREIEVSRLRERGIRYADLADLNVPPRTNRTYRVTGSVLSDLAGIDTRFRLVVDSLDFLLEILPPAQVLTLARQIRHRAQTLGGRGLLVLQPGVHPTDVTGPLEDLADLVLELTSDPRGGRFGHRLIVRKVRNHPERSQALIAEVGDHGFSVLPDDGSETASQ